MHQPIPAESALHIRIHIHIRVHIRVRTHIQMRNESPGHIHTINETPSNKTSLSLTIHRSIENLIGRRGLVDQLLRIIPLHGHRCPTERPHHSATG